LLIAISLICCYVAPTKLSGKLMDPIHILQFEVKAFLFSMTAILGFKMLTRRIGLNGLLLRKQDNGQVSPERIQLLLATIAMSAKYISETVHGSSGVMPDVSPGWLYLFGVSSGIYVSVKAMMTMGGKYR
jgi:hypothetical protein